MRGRGRPSTGTVVQVRIPADTLAAVDAAAAAEEVPRAEMVRRILAAWTERYAQLAEPG